MGMSIDKAIEHDKEQLEIFGGEHKEFIETSIATMRKYQKIEQILKSLDDGEISYSQMTYYLREVLENGKNII